MGGIACQFQNAHRIETPVPIAKGLWQSPSVMWEWLHTPLRWRVCSLRQCDQISRKIVQKGLIPGERVINVSLPRSYTKRCQSSGFLGRPYFPRYPEQLKIINQYLESQHLRPGDVPNLRFASPKIKNYDGPILASDVIWRQTSRKTEWGRLMAKRHRQRGTTIPEVN